MKENLTSCISIQLFEKVFFKSELTFFNFSSLVSEFFHIMKILLHPVFPWLANLSFVFLVYPIHNFTDCLNLLSEINSVKCEINLYLLEHYKIIKSSVSDSEKFTNQLSQ